MSELHTHINALVLAWNRIPKSGRGRTISESECDAANAIIGDIVPSWYWALLQSADICDSTLEVHLQNDIHEMHMLTPKHITQEYSELIPGIYLSKLGYIPIAGCGLGSGDPFFCKFIDIEHCDIVQVHHGVRLLDQKHIPRDCYVQVAFSFMDLFSRTVSVS